MAERQLTNNGVVISDLVCLKCGYNLRTQGVYNNCPECGEKVSTSIMYYQEPMTPDMRMATVVVITMSLATTLITLILTTRYRPARGNRFSLYSNAYEELWLRQLIVTVIVLLLCNWYINITKTRRRIWWRRLPFLLTAVTAFWLVFHAL